ncbi:hypothetical protein RI367_002757 [Sorochytrium milnesiophthora]
MTRYTSLHKKTHLPATQFAAPASLPTKTELQATPSKSATTLADAQATPVNGHKRKQAEPGDQKPQTPSWSADKRARNSPRPGKTQEDRRRASEKRREKRQHMSKICFHCREPGHTIKECSALLSPSISPSATPLPATPMSFVAPSSSSSSSAAVAAAAAAAGTMGSDLPTPAPSSVASADSASSSSAPATPAPAGVPVFNVTVCYICGSPGHRTKLCPHKDTAPRDEAGKTKYPYAACFICRQVGHLVAQCPLNTKGVYPNGGSCKYCQSVDHLAKDCDIKRKSRHTESGVGVTTLGTISVHQSADDDDLTLALHNVDRDVSSSSSRRSQHQTPSKRPMSVTAATPLASTPRTPATSLAATTTPGGKKKVVQF